MKKVFVLMFVLVGTLAFGQEEPPADPEPVLDAAWTLALFLNGFLIVLGAQLIKRFKSGLPPAVLQVIILAASFAVPWATTAVSNVLGFPVDFGGLLDALMTAGTANVTFNATKHIVKPIAGGGTTGG